MTTPAQPPLPAPDQGPAPAPLTVACSLVALEALALLVLGVVELSSIGSGKLTMGITTSLFFVVYGVGLAVFGWLLHRLQSWTRAPIVLAQLIQLGVAWSFRSGGTALVAVLLAVTAVVTLAGIFHPASLRALAEEDASPG